MARIIPFKGLRYAPSRASLENVVAPPFDVIGEEQQDLLYRRHPNNIVRLIKGKDLPNDGPLKNKYTRARKYLEEWIAKGVLCQDERPSIYIYEQEYQYSTDKPRIRRGFMALARLEEEKSGVILGHEHTLMSPKLDRLSLLKECKANLSPIFSLFSQPEGAIDSILLEAAFTPTTYDFTDDNNVRNRLWVVSDPAIIDALVSQMEDQTLIIADGHHRYETSLIYRHIRRSEMSPPPEDAPYDYTMMTFVNLDGEGVSIYPIHRLVYGIPDFDPERFRRQLEEHFEITPYNCTCSDCETAAEELLADMVRIGKGTHCFGLYLGGRRLDLLKARDVAQMQQLMGDTCSKSRKTLDVSVIEMVILNQLLDISSESISKEEHIRFTPSWQNALESVRRNETQIALLLNPTTPDQVRAVTSEGDKMPQKSTFFYPKLLSGLVINQLES